MNSQEKMQVYDLLKTASDALLGFSSPAFNENQPVFNENPQVSASASVKTQEKPDSSKQIESETVKTEPQVSISKQTEVKQVTEKPFSTVSAPQLSAIAEKIARCQRCPLCKERNKVVPGTGNTSPFVLVIGEGPGYEENQQGLPFVGPAGQLLDKMLAAIELSRNSNTFITNIVKCRPPMNRNPYPEEADACSSFLQAQIAVLKPKMILCAGTVAAKNLLKTELGVTKLRGQFYEYSGIPVAVTYHPSALLRDPSLKRPAWEDLKMFKIKLSQIAPEYNKAFVNTSL